MSCATQSGLKTLPTELLYHIIRLAASTDFRTAHVCAHVSKQVCQWTSPDRWKTIVITCWYQLDDLVRVLFDAELLENNTELPVGFFTSLPSSLPGDFVENLFIDTEDPSEEANTSHQMYSFADFTGVIPFFRHLNYLALGSEEADTFLLQFQNLSPSKLLCVYAGGEVEVPQLDRILTEHLCGPHWIRCRCNANAAADEQVYSNTKTKHSEFCPRFVPSLSRIRRRLKSLHVIGIDNDSSVTGVPTPFRLLENLRSGSTDQGSFLYSLVAESRHGENDRAWPAVDDTSADLFYFSSALFQHAADDNLSHLLRHSKLLDAKSWASKQAVTGKSPYDNPYGNISRSYFTDTAHGATSVRYDTRQFAFRPCEISAIHLRRFFQELVITPSLVSAPLETTEPSNNFTHVGPRHAAPHRGAGNYHHLNVSQRERVSPLQPLLDNLGSRQFRKLELCWDPLTPLQRSEVPAAAQATRIESESGWPMERQDIWTNTTSQNNTARAPPPHKSPSAQRTPAANKAPRQSTAPSNGASRWKVNPQDVSANSRAFRGDLSDSIRTTLGWTAQDQEQLGLTASTFCSTKRIAVLGEPQFNEEQLHHSFHRIVDELVKRTTPHSNTANSTNESPAVHLAVQAPINKLKLGEHYVPYTKEERIAWFLDNLDTDEA